MKESASDEQWWVLLIDLIAPTAIPQPQRKVLHCLLVGRIRQRVEAFLQQIDLVQNVAVRLEIGRDVGQGERGVADRLDLKEG